MRVYNRLSDLNTVFQAEMECVHFLNENHDPKEVKADSRDAMWTLSGT